MAVQGDNDKAATEGLREPATDPLPAAEPEAVPAAGAPALADAVQPVEAAQDHRPVPKLNGVEPEELDWSNKPQERHTKSPEIGLEYDPRPHEDQARRHIAYLLIGLLWLVVACMFVLIAFGAVTVADIKEFASLLGPVVTLVSAATGFYYGTKSK